MAQDKVNKLASLVTGAPPSTRPAPVTPTDAGDPDDDKLDVDVGKVLALVDKLAGENLFHMQVLIEACADELREQIRSTVENEEGEDDE